LALLDERPVKAELPTMIASECFVGNRGEPPILADD
jgi:hypothetical protein